MLQRQRRIVVPLIAVLVCMGAAGPAAAQVIACEKDTDCPVGSICSQGKCEELKCLQVWQPVCGVDSKTYSNRCFARAAHVEVAHEGECPRICGGLVGVLCPKSQFCELLPGTCDVPEVPGICVDFPDPAFCPRLWQPVCGCDGQTYANDCFRRVAGVSKKHDGECKGAKGVDECRNHEECNKKESCQFPDATCGVHALGRCAKRPEICPDVWNPECGCDLETYSNGCERLRAGVSLLHPGVCGEPCGGVVGPLCPQGKACDSPPGKCDQPNAPGECVGVPEVCPEVEDPVCGCDGETYGNDCKRLKAGVAKDYHGPCIDR